MTIFIARQYHTDYEKYEGKFLEGENYTIFKEDVDIYNEKNELLCKFRKHVLTEKETHQLYQLKSAAKRGYTRPSASGFEKEKYKYIISKSSGKKLHVLTSQSTSGIVGFYDSLSHFGSSHASIQSNEKCRMTAFTSKHIDQYRQCLPIFQKVNRLFQSLVPQFYRNQWKASRKLNSEYRIPKTVFTTITVNKNFRTAVHKDAGDFREGFGIMVVVSDNDMYQGAFTLFPEYQIGVDCRNGDLLAFDVHQWHCNSEMIGQETSTRLSFIFYLREKMLKTCPSE